MKRTVALVFYLQFVYSEGILQFSCADEPREFPQFLRQGSLTGFCISDCRRNVSLRVSGSQYYTDDSSICRSALHAGVINENGGAIHVRRSSGRKSYPSTYHNGVTSRASGEWQRSSTFYFASKKCVRPLGLRRNILEVKNFRSSSTDYTWSGAGWYAHLARLDSGSLVNAWRPAVDDRNQWWEVDMGDIFRVHAIVTQGSSRYRTPQYIKSYKIKYSVLQNGPWFYVLTGTGNEEVFKGNWDKDGRVTNNFLPPLTAKYIRLEPLTWHNHISLRAEIMVCKIGQIPAA